MESHSKGARKKIPWKRNISTTGERGHSTKKFINRGNARENSSNNHFASRERMLPQMNTVSKPFGFRRLDALSEFQGLKIMEVLAVQKTMDDFISLCNQADLKDDFIARIVIILGKLARIEFDKIIVQLLSQISTSGFLMQLLCYIVSFQEKDISEADKPNTFLIFDNIAAYSYSVSRLLPTLACEKFSPILKQCNNILMNFEFEGIENVQEMVNITLEKINVEKEKRKVQPVKTTIAEEALQFAAPPENFRDLSTVPTEKDLSYQYHTFLRPNITEGPYQGVEHYLDVQFRLLREDFVRPLREGIKEFIQKKRVAASSGGNSKRIRINNVKIYERIAFGKAQIIEDKIGFPIHFDPSKKFCSSINWEQSKRFMLGSLVVLSKDDFQTIILGKILKRAVPDLSEGWIVIELNENLKDCSIFNYGNWIMAESNLFFGAYSYVLEALKNYSEVNFPLKSYIIDAQFQPEMPSYLDMHTEVVYELPRANGDNVTEEILPALYVNLRKDASWPAPNDLGLDESQYEAYRGALTQKVMLIQGPPGTGKTFLGLKIATTLLKNKIFWQSDLRPMVVVCYTNHALDQFLMGLSKVTSSIVRVGGGCKEKSLEKFSLRNMSREVHVDGALIGMLKEFRLKFSELREEYQKLEKAISVIEEFAGIVDPDCLLEYGALPPRQADSFNSKEDLIEWLVGVNFKEDFSSLIMEAPEDPIAIAIGRGQRLNSGNLYFYISFSRIDKQFGTNNFIKEKSLYMQHQLKSPLTDPQLLNMNEVNRLRNLKFLPTEKRWQLYRHWISILIEQLQNKMTAMQPKLLTAAANVKQARKVEDQCVMSKCQVIGMTTTYAASKQDILKQLRPRIVIVEEAAEVLEAHVMVSLTGSVEHLIMIGDHLQLRPNPAVYELAQKFRLNVSLFERLINNKVNCVSLTTQHRMRPEIARLVSPAIYPILINHESVFKYPPVKGVTKNLMFIDHSHHQEVVEEIQSFRNVHEAQFISALVRYLCLQGYSGSQITVLATYKGQMFYLNKLRSENTYLSDVRITVVDNYQGEENDIIILSLVRSNEDGEVGFLKTENRVCVALSRAKHGLFIIGNMKNLLMKGDIWPKVNKELTDMDAVQLGLTLRCEVHSTITIVTDANDFKNVPEGGCLLQCNTLMQCSHICAQMCHTTDRKHQNFKCVEKCPRPLCIKNHECPDKCFEPCKPCQVPTNVILPCNHPAVIPCHMHLNASEYKCREVVNFTLLCNHQRNVACYETRTPLSIGCLEPCKFRLNCGHVCEKSCHLFDDPDHLEYICRKPCEENNAGCMGGNHLCKLACHQECEKCVIMVKKRLPCGHEWKMKCHEEPTRKVCGNKCPEKLSPCGHKCLKKCKDDCHPCLEKVQKIVPKCGHSQMMLCGDDPSSFSKCKAVCQRMLPCGHLCTKKCDEVCTTECKILINYPGVTKCGHVIKIACHKQSVLAPTSLELLRSCREPCNKLLQPCNHKCKGTCGSCWQGNFHQACKEPCGRTNICGHSCKAPCAEKCPPCNESCEVRCQHSNCPKKCGQPCVPCVERCSLKCPHVKCTMRCGQDCNVKACEEPCLKTLKKCGHKCVGLCGDRCICEECNGDLRDIFFGTEEDETARFVTLPDCNHSFVSSDLKQWLESDGEIKEKLCPRCNTAIRTSLRYNHVIKRHAQDVQMVKRKIFGNWKDIFKVGSEVQSVLKLTNFNFRTDLQECTCVVNMIVKKVSLLDRKLVKKNNRWFTPPLSLNQVTSLKQYAEIMKTLATLTKKAFTDNDVNLKAKLESEVKDFITNFAILLKGHDALRLSDQEASDINTSLRRLDVLIQLCLVESSPNYSFLDSEMKLQANKLSLMVRGIAPYDTNVHQKNCQILKQLAQKVKCKITPAEIKLVVAAMGFSTGHWYKCPNGHPYAIADCGGAVMVSKCNECGAKIGGINHTLQAGNSFAPEIDGAAHPAWPTMLLR